MVVKYLGDNQYQGLAADTKPTNASANSNLWETDTGKVFVYNGTSWLPRWTRGTYEYILYKDGATTYCADSDGSILSSSTTAGVPIQYALDNALRKKIYQAAGTYSLSSTVTVSQPETRWEMDPGCILEVPGNYTGSAITLAPAGVTLSNCIIDGGKIQTNFIGETFSWTAYDMQAASGKAHTGNRISNTYIRSAGNAIRLQTTHTTGWANSNTFQDIFMDRFVNGIVFDVAAGTALGGGYGTNDNLFKNIVVQCTAATPLSLYGIKDVWGERNEFNHVSVWDTPAGAKSGTISTSAWRTKIVGGRWNAFNTALFVDLGRATSIEMPDMFMEPHVSPYMGWMTPRHASGDGSLSSVTDSGTRTWVTQITDGYYRRFTTAAALNSPAGFRDFAQNATSFRYWSPYVRIKFRVATTSNTRLWIGFSSSSAVPTGIDALNALHGWMIGYRETDTNYQIIGNDGAGATLFGDAGVAKGAGITTLELLMDDTLPKCGYSINNATPVFVTNTASFPANNPVLYFMAMIETSDALAKTFDLFDCFINARRTN